MGADERIHLLLLSLNGLGHVVAVMSPNDLRSLLRAEHFSRTLLYLMGSTDPNISVVARLKSHHADDLVQFFLDHLLLHLSQSRTSPTFPLYV